MMDGMEVNAQKASPSVSPSSPGTGAKGAPMVFRRSAASMRINLSDPAIPGPSEPRSTDARSPPGRYSPRALHTSPQALGTPDPKTADPHHQRAPSLGELHNELEQEQEAQVNRLLQMIRQQQLQLQHLQATQQQQQQQQEAPSSTSTRSLLPQTRSPCAVAETASATTPSSERSFSFTNATVPQTTYISVTVPAPLPTPQPSSARTRSPASNLSASTPSRQSSHSEGTSITRRGNKEYSPDARHVSGAVGSEDSVLRGESAYYQAETQALMRENQMLKVRVRELEGLLREAKGGLSGDVTRW